MNYEQKYKEALDRAKAYKKYDYMMINSALDNIFPELKESEDERLRKTTIGFLKEFADKGYENAVECIDWLEQQKSE